MTKNGRRCPTGYPTAKRTRKACCWRGPRNTPCSCISNHPRWRVHAQLDDVNWFHEIVTGKVKGPDGYLYEPVWLHPSDAEKRGIKNGDICQDIQREGHRPRRRLRHRENHARCGLYRPRRRYDPIVPGELDRGGAINTITPHKGTSRNCRGGMVVSGFLVEVESANLDELRQQYPEAFKRPYDRASGLRFDRILAGGEQK